MPTTRTGRIVYHRASHLFRYSDVRRIVDRVAPVAGGDLETAVHDVSAIIGTFFAVEADLVRWIEQRGWLTIPAELQLRLIEELFTFLSRLASQAPNLIMDLVGRFAPPAEPEKVSPTEVVEGGGNGQEQ